MKKRDFLKVLFGLGGSLATSPKVAHASSVSEWPDIDHPKVYRDYRYHWTGLKGSQENTWVVGQWIAWPILGHGIPDFPNRQPFYFLSVPGMIGGPYAPGSIFNICGRGRLITSHTAEDQIHEWIASGERYIRALIDQKPDSSISFPELIT